MKLILVRYGEHTDGYLNDRGKQTMKLVAERLRSSVQEKTAIICAKIPRAIEGAEILAQEFGLGPVQSFSELYAAPEDGIEVNLNVALGVINAIANNTDVVIAIISREYIEALSRHFGLKEKNLNRGEFLVINYKQGDKNYIIPYWKKGAVIVGAISLVLLILFNTFFYIWSYWEAGTSIAQYFFETESWQLLGFSLLCIFMPLTLLGAIIGYFYGKYRSKSINAKVIK